MERQRLWQRVGLTMLSLIMLVISGCSDGGNEVANGPSCSGNNCPSAVAGHNFNGPVREVLGISDGTGDIYVVGTFTTYGTRPVRPVMRLRPDGSLNERFTLAGSITGDFISMALADDHSGDLYVADSHVNLDNISTSPAVGLGHIRRVHGDGTVDPTFALGTINFEFTGVRMTVPFDPLFKAVVRSLAPAGDGSGRFYAAMEGSYNGTLVGPVIRINPDGSIDPTFDARTVERRVHRIVPLNDGSGEVYIGTFGQVSPQGFRALHPDRLRSDGTLDPSFDTGTGSRLFDSSMTLMALVGDGSSRDLFAVVFWANFADPLPFANGFRGLVRINGSGAVDATSPRPQVDSANTVVALAKASDGTGDWFVEHFIGSDPLKVQRYKADGTLDSIFTAGEIVGNHDTSFHFVVPAPDNSGDVYVAGEFSSYNGVAVSNIVRINRDGTLDQGSR